ncbi:hypothetical protein D6J04_00885 [Legionella taurinensis]|uniref:Uncharacterized protein n=1 Tax=Legionella taurinensis TaxID=70611 RepID=A0A3A5LSI9_9GAMM|nr:hypothetical protein D6J04_00885 [Legionella taurinensis]RJT67498.1 hypothetical protein D6J03_07845 [Legionella taurinensis]
MRYNLVTQNDKPSGKKHDNVQVKNPKTERHVKIDRTEGKLSLTSKALGFIRVCPLAESLNDYT